MKAKFLFLLFFFASIILFLEELDYGIHYYDYFLGKSRNELVEQVATEIPNRVISKDISRGVSLLVLPDLGKLSCKYKLSALSD